jgi:hypothetical protein
MKTWERARVREQCGRCGKPQEVGDPVLAITLPDLGAAARRRIRCEPCAGEPVNEAQLEAHDTATSFRRGPAPLTEPEVRALTARPAVFDAKMAAAGKDAE